MSTASPPPIAQRPPRRAGALRLVPLTLLVICAVIAAFAGRVVGYSPAANPIGAATPAKTPHLHSALPRSCTLPVHQDLRGREPWLDSKLEAASEKKYTRHIAKEQPAYVRGEDGWIFWSDFQVNDMSQSVGRETLDSAAVHAWAKYLTSLQRSARRNGSRFYVMVAPAKWDVYPDELPRWAQELRGRDSLDILMKAHPEIPFIDVRSALRTAARKHDTYDPLDSHWTTYGGYIAWKAATRCLRASDTADKALDVPDLSGVGLVPSNNEYATYGIPTPTRPDRTTAEYAAPLPKVTVRSLVSGAPVPIASDDVVDQTLTPVRTATRGAQTDQRLLVLRDSTGGALSPLWESSFASTIQVTHGLGTTDTPDVSELERRYHPDITMLVFTERYLGYQPPA